MLAITSALPRFVRSFVSATLLVAATALFAGDSSAKPTTSAALPLPSTVYVDDNFVGLLNGTNPPGPGTSIGFDAFATIQGGVNAVDPGGTVIVAPGTYTEDVAVTKAVTIQGAGAGSSIVRGVRASVNSQVSTFQFLADGIRLDGFTITREGNTVADWNDGLNNAGVGIQLRTSGIVSNCLIVGNRTGIDINACSGISVYNNVIDDNRTGMILRNQTTNCSIFENSIQGNWTTGVLFLDLPPAQGAAGSAFSGNAIAGNWIADIQDRMTTLAPKDFSANWLGTTTPIVSNTNPVDPPYATQIPVAYGGTSTNPGGAPQIAGVGAANVDFTPYLDSGVDTNSGFGTFGFQGDFSSLTVTAELAQVGAVTRVQEGQDLLVAGGTVHVRPGTYTENVTITKRLALDGAGSGGNAVSGNPAVDTILVAANAGLPVLRLQAGGASAGLRLVVKELRAQGGSSGVEASSPASFLRIENVTARNNGSGIAFTSSGASNDVHIDQCELSANGNAGLRVASSLTSFSQLAVTNTNFVQNGANGFGFGGVDTLASTDLAFTSCAFTQNGGYVNNGEGDISFFGFNGNASLTNVTVDADGQFPIQFRGRGVFANTATWTPLGTVALTNVSVTGTPGKAALTIQQYSDLSGVTFSNVDLDGINFPGISQYFETSLRVVHTGATPLGVGNTSFKCVPIPGPTARLGIWNEGTGGVSVPCSATFVGAVTHPEKELCVVDTADNAPFGDIVFDPSAAIWFGDADGDGAGDPLTTVQSCTQPSGFLAAAGDSCPLDPNKTSPGICGCGVPDTDTDGDATADCIDGCPLDASKIAPGICGCGVSDVNTDGDSLVDCQDGCPQNPLLLTPATWYADVDGDGYGNLASTTSACSQPIGYVANSTDCNDANAAVNPGATEVCGNGLDDDCDGGIDNPVIAPVHNITQNTYHCTIQLAVNLALPGDVLDVAAGTYTENVLVNKAVTIRGNGGAPATRPLVNGAGTAQVFSITASNVTLENLRVELNQTTTLHGIYAPNSGTYSGLVVRDCFVAGTRTSGASVFGSYGIRLGSFGGAVYDAVTLTNNTMTHVGTSPLGRGLRSNNAHGTWTGNASTGVYSAQIGDVYAGALHLDQNALNGLCEINNLAYVGAHTFDQNVCLPGNANGPGTDFAQLELKNLTTAGSTLSIGQNQFTNYVNFGLFAGRASGVTVHDNTFAPAATATNFRSVRLDTKQRTNGVQVPYTNVGLALVNNAFQGNLALGQTGIAFQIANSDSASSFGAITVSGNDFGAGHGDFIALNAQVGVSTLDPIWAGLTASTMAKVAVDVPATGNRFDAGLGLAPSVSMSLLELYVVEDAVQHAIDDGALGFVRVNASHVYVTPLSFLLPDAPTPRVQRAVDSAIANDTVHVAAGTYLGALTIGTTLVLEGANVGVDPCTGSRSPESVLMPDSGAATIAGTALFVVVTADDVVIDGFDLNGDNPALTSPFTANGANPDADIAISSEMLPMAGDRLVVRNDVVRNFFQFGIVVGSAGGVSRGGTIESNQIQNIPYWAGVLAYDDYYAAIERNCMEDVWRGVQTNNYYVPKPVTASATIVGNTITTRTQAIAGDATYTDVTGILVNLHYQNASTWTVTDNTLTNLTPSSADSNGIEVWSIQSAAAVTLERNDATDFQNGYLLWNCPTSSTITVTGGTLSGGTHGVVATNHDSYGDASSSSYAIRRVTVTGASGNAILAEDSPLNTNGSTVTIDATNNVLANCGTGVRAIGTSGATALDVHDNSITGSASFAIANEDLNAIDAACNWYGTSAGGPIAAGIFGAVTYSPWLVSGVDSDGLTSGFQPAPGACTGTPVFVVVSSVTHVVCPGGSDGAIDVTPSGGTPPYAYLWTNGATTQDVAVLLAGNYSITVTDANGTTASVGATVNPGIDVTAPTITVCAPPQSGIASASCSAPTPNFAALSSATDNCSMPVITQVPAAGTLLGIGFHAVTITATDAALNTSTCSTSFTVLDTTPPSISACASALVLSPGVGCTSPSLPNLTNSVVASDNCGAVTITQVPVAGTLLMPGTIPVVITVTDGSNNTATCTTSVTVTDITPPAITVCAPPQTLSAGAACTALVPSLTGLVSATDNCTAVTITQAPAAGTSIPLGATLVTFTAADTNGNSSTCSALVTVVDTTPPSLTCPPTANVTTAALRDPPSTGLPTVVDACDATPTVTFADNRAGLSNCNATGVIVRTWTAVDDAGNSSSCVQNVFVTDSIAPILAGCPTNTTLNAGVMCNAVATWTAPSAHDIGFFEGFENPAWSAGDYATQPSTNWNEYSSELFRVASGTNGIPSHSGGFHGVADSTMLPLAPFDYTGLFSRLGGYSPVFGTGFTTQTAVYIDLTNPAVAANTYGWDLATAASNQSNGHRRDFVFHTASDALGNVLVGGSNNSAFTRRNDLASINHHVITTSGWYVFESDFRNVGGVLSVDLNLRSSGGTLLWTETRSDPSDLIATIVGGNRYTWFTFLEVATLSIDDTRLTRNTTVTCVPPSGSTFPLGTTPVTCSSVDACGNLATCTFTVTVLDVTAPSITVCAPAQTISADANCQAFVPNLTGAVVATDNCGPVTVTQSPLAGTVIGTGPTVVTLTATDGSNNTATCTTTITVNDTTAPSITTCANAQNLTANVLCQATVPNLTAQVVTSDGCGSVTVTQSPVAGAVIGLGVTTVTFTATDGAGNFSTCSANLTVVDTTPPALACPSGQTLATNASCQAAVPNFAALATASDCNGVIVTQVPAAGMFVGLGTTGVTVTATDGAGNFSSCSVSLTVMDLTPPTISSCAPTTPLTANGSCQATIPGLAGLVAANDACGGVTITQLPTPGTTVGLGSFPVVLTVMDGAGNFSTCTSFVVVTSPDTDGDGTVNCLDGCPADPAKTSPGTCGCGVAETNSDGDAIPDCVDNCDTVGNPTQADVDMDGVGDACDNCVNLANPTQANCDGDMLGDACEIALGEPDCNLNGIPDACDIIALTSPDVNLNGIPDECEVNGGVPFCFGDMTGTPCPCGNNGLSGNGCASSLNPAGAHLQGSGMSSITSDSLVLNGSGMPNAPALYFQGTARQTGGAGQVFGDGLRCASGTIVRLKTLFNLGGASQFPVMGDPSVSVRGLVTVPGARTYQIWYRNAAVFCTTSTFNLSNGLDVIWAP